MKATAEDVIAFVSEKMGISSDEAEDALCIRDKDMVIEIQVALDKGRYQHVVGHDLDTGKAELSKIASSLGLAEGDLSVWVEDHMIWIRFGPNIAEGIIGEGPNAWLATADFYREWFLAKFDNL
jgi:hypothetical protein